jgi:hypothetical protein
MNPTAPTPADRFNTFIEGLYTCASDAVGYCFVEIPLVVLLWRRLFRISRRFHFILARYRTGALPPPGSTRRPASKPTTLRVRRPTQIPTRFGWVTHEVSMAVFHRYDLEDLLDDPELPALVAAAPQLGSALRPLCHMMAVKKPAWLRLPRRRRPKPPRPKPTIIRLGAGQNWRRPTPLWPTREEAEKYDAKT